MRKIVYVFILATCISSLNATNNLLRNGDFENGSLDHWESKQQAGSKKKLFMLTLSAKSGRFSICASGDKQNKYNGFITLVQNIEARVIKGKQYQLQCFANADVKNANGKNFSIAVRQVNDKGGSVVYTKIPIVLKKNSWEYYVKQFTPHKDAVKFQIYLIASNLSSEDKVYIDNIYFSLIQSAGKSFNPKNKLQPNEVINLKNSNLNLKINSTTGLLQELILQKQVIHPQASDVSCVYVEKNGKETLLVRDKKTSYLNTENNYRSQLTTSEAKVPFIADIEYSIKDGALSEIVIFTATSDINYPVKLGVRHGFNSRKWKNVFCALRPLRIIPSDKATIFSYRSLPGDLNLTKLDQYQRTVYPFTIMENNNYFLLTGSGNLDNFVTVSPNYPAGYLPSVQQNPRSVKKGQKFRFELTWKIFNKKQNLMRDVWRWYSEHTFSNNSLIKDYVPYKTHKFRSFYPGCFASSTYFNEAREKRLFPASNVWFYSWNDNINEWYPTSGSWWLNGNSWKSKMTAPKLKAYVDRLQGDGHKLIFYLRQLANLRQRGKEKPESWFRKTAGGSLDLYGGGYEVKLPPHVAADVGYKTIPWGTFDFDNDEFRNHYVKTIKKVIKFYNPAAIGWDMGWHPNHMGMFAVQAEIYEWLKKTYPDKKVVSNESSGPTQFYSDLVLLENGLLGGKSKYDFEVAKGQNTSMVCLERWNLFRAAVKSNLHGTRTWLSTKGLEANKKYLDFLLSHQPELKSDINEAARLCQLRMSIYDLAFGASPGYLEEIKPVPEALVKISGDVNGLPLVTKSFMVRLPNGTDSEQDLAASVWCDKKSFRAIVYNDSANEKTTALRLNKNHFKQQGWNESSLKGRTQFEVSPNKQHKQNTFKLETKAEYFVLTGKIPPFTAIIIFKDK